MNVDGKSGCRLLVDCGADGTLGMVLSIVMVVRGFYQGGEQQEDSEKERKALEHEKSVPKGLIDSL